MIFVFSPEKEKLDKFLVIRITILREPLHDFSVKVLIGIENYGIQEV